MVHEPQASCDTQLHRASSYASHDLPRPSGRLQNCAGGEGARATTTTAAAVGLRWHERGLETAIVRQPRSSIPLVTGLTVAGRMIDTPVDTPDTSSAIHSTFRLTSTAPQVTLFKLRAWPTRLTPRARFYLSSPRTEHQTSLTLRTQP